MAKELSPRELEVLSSVWRCWETEPKIDINKLASICGYTNPKSAYNAWMNIKKKITQVGEAEAANGADATTPTKATPKATPRKRGKKASEDEEVDDDTPVKKSKTKKGQETLEQEAESPVKKEEHVDDGGDFV